MTKGNDPAFPVKGGMVFYAPKEVEQEVKNSADEYNAFTRPYEGLTKREYFAAMAMQGLLTRGLDKLVDEKRPSEVIAELSYKYADSMIEKGNEKQ